MNDDAVIYIGIDDTDTLDTPGTNQLARLLVQRVANQFRCLSIVRHQLLFDPRVPYTSKNGSASILLQAIGTADVAWLIAELRQGMQEAYVEGSDPGLCVATAIPREVEQYGRLCQAELVQQQVARDLAARHRLYLEGLGGTEGGVIGALAAVGLRAPANDGRVVQVGTWPDDLSGPCEIATLAARGIQTQVLATNQPLRGGLVDVGKHCRPNLRNGQLVLFAEPVPAEAGVWRAVRLV